MILHAKVAKLYQYLHDDEFSRIMRHVESSLDEGLNHFELELDRLDDDIKMSLLEALETMGYQVTYDPESDLADVTLGD